MNIYTVLITKDTFTKIPVIVAEHEVRILQDIHGENHVVNVDEVPMYVDMGKPCGEFNPEENEYSRLVMKYGKEQVMKSIGTELDLRRITAPAKRQTRKTAKEATTE